MDILLKNVLLIDDDDITIFLHRHVLKEARIAQNIEVAETVSQALERLNCPDMENCQPPDLIFLGLNMPGLTSWDFIDEYKKIKNRHNKESIIVVLTTSANPDDNRKASEISEVAEFRKKPMTPKMVSEIVRKYFPV